MKKQIVQVSMLQSAKVMAGLYLVLSLPIALLMAIPMSMSGHGVGLAFFIGFPLGYMVGAFLFTLIGAWVYNLVAARIGGFEFTTVEVGAGQQA